MNTKKQKKGIMLKDLKVFVEYMISYYYSYSELFFGWEECRDLFDLKVDISFEEFIKIKADRLSEIIDGLSELHDEIYIELGMSREEAKKIREKFQELGKDDMMIISRFIDTDILVNSLIIHTRSAYICVIITLCYCYHYYKGKNKEKIVSALEKFLENLIHMIERKDWDKEWGGFESLVPIEEKIFLSYCFLKMALSIELEILNRKIVEKIKQALRETPIWEIKDPEIVHYFKDILKDKKILRDISGRNISEFPDYKEIFPNLPWWWEKYNKIHLSLDKIWKMKKIRKIATFIQKMEVFILIFLFACFLILQQLKFFIMFILFLLFMEYLKKNI